MISYTACKYSLQAEFYRLYTQIKWFEVSVSVPVFNPRWPKSIQNMVCISIKSLEVTTEKFDQEMRDVSPAKEKYKLKKLQRRRKLLEGDPTSLLML